ncbi:hypothetical protein PIB30_022004 [Stylosanthes scabra]|uniref:Di19 C-terminal domain-containing protein n=1 Tax=Stylosanthes scabra TaxID=79078 RepID=A0ABU6X947_9FABA|nr:hypothetical protein [Stylosanthes scabra]
MIMIYSIISVVQCICVSLSFATIHHCTCWITLNCVLYLYIYLQICPVCVVWVGTNMVDHITAQHGSMIKAQLKSRRYKESYPSLSFLRCSKDVDDGQWQSFSDGLSPTISTSSSKAACDPFLSFLYSGAAASAENENAGPDSSSEVSTEETHSSDTVIKRDVVQPSLSDKDQTEKARRSGFVQELLMSTILDPGF